MFTVLLLSADPKENYPLNLDQEFRRIEKVHQASKYRDEFDIKSCLATTYDDLRKNLLQHKPSIIHFCGHGLGKEGIVLVDENGKKETIHTEILAKLFKICQEENQNISCVVFNACHAEFQAKEINKYVKYCIGMSHEIKDEHAIKFAPVFYQAIFSKAKVETAFELGRNEIHRLVNNNSKTVRAEYDPAPDDIIALQHIPDYEIPKLIVNKSLDELYVNQGLLQQERIISYEQWNELQLILLTIDFDILKNVCKDTLKKDVQDIEPKILSLETLVNLKELLLEKYPTHKKNGTITILDFANRLIIKEELGKSQKEEIKNWLDKITKEKKIDLPSLPETNKEKVLSSDTILNSHLLISINQNTDEVNSPFSLEAELIYNYQEGDEKYESATISSRQEGINEVLLKDIGLYIEKIISLAIDNLPPNHILTIELFVPFDYLGETFELCKIPIPSRRTKKMKPLGSRYQFTVRCLDRYVDKELFSEHTKRWVAIKNDLLELNNLYIEQKCDNLKLSERGINWDALSTKWQRNNFYAINVIDELPVDAEEYFDSFLLSGVPMSLWNRCPEVKCGVDDNCNVEQKFKELLKIEYFKDLSKIFERIYQLRQDAHNAGDIAKEYLGYHLGFICDRPDPIPSNLRERLNQRGLQGSN